MLPGIEHGVPSYHVKIFCLLPRLLGDSATPYLGMFTSGLFAICLAHGKNNLNNLIIGRDIFTNF